MPWCDTCSKFWNPTSVGADGTCPTCGRLLEKATAPVSEPLTAKNVDPRALAGSEAKVPWHFKLLVAAIVAYLGWRIVQLVAAVV